MDTYGGGIFHLEKDEFYHPFGIFSGYRLNADPLDTFLYKFSRVTPDGKGVETRLYTDYAVVNLLMVLYPEKNLMM